MIKAFLSYSSVQAEFVKVVAAELGDSCIFDNRTFEAGAEIMNEIVRGLQQSTIFVLFISNEALDSTWVRSELGMSKELKDRGLIHKFRAYIIDSKVSCDDERIPQWIREEIILRVYDKPLLVARKIKEDVRNISRSLYPQLGTKDNLFIGRNTEMNEIEMKYYKDGQFNERRAIVASGFPGMGRRKVLIEYIQNKLKNKELYIPLTIELSNRANIEDFIMQVNDMILYYDSFSILKILGGNKSDKLLASINLLKELYNKQEVLLIRDSGACILTNGRLSSWFYDIIKHRDLPRSLIFFITSKYRPSIGIERKFKELITIQINPLTNTDRTNLFYAYSQNNGIILSSEDTKFLLSRFTGNPNQIFHAIDILKSRNISYLKRHIDEIMDIGDKDVISTMNFFSEETGAIDLLVLLSQFEFISYDLLYKLAEDIVALDDLLDKFYTFSIYENFGSSNSYIRLNLSISDYIHRSGLVLNKSFSKKLQDIKDDFILNKEQCELKDLSYFLYNVSSLLETNPSMVKDKYLIPSYFIRSIAEEYKKKNYENAKQLCETIINESQRFYAEIYRETYYWYCLSLARLHDDAFFEAIEYFQTNEQSNYHFLLGFYHRCCCNFRRAEKEYEKVLEECDKSTARREMVIVKQCLGKYDEALDIARRNYEERRNNTFHVEAYHSCLVRKKNLNAEDKVVLRRLVSEMEQSFDKKKSIMVAKMIAEYDFYVENKRNEAIKDMQDLIRKTQGKWVNIPKRSLKEMYNKCFNAFFDLDFDEGEIEDNIGLI